MKISVIVDLRVGQQTEPHDTGMGIYFHTREEVVLNRGRVGYKTQDSLGKVTGKRKRALEFGKGFSVTEPQ